MEELINFIVIFVIVVAVLSRVKKAAGDMAKKGPNSPVQPANMIVPPNLAAGLTQLGLSNSNLDKIVKVYGAGAMLGTDEVSILLNVSPETAQRYLSQLARQGRAEIVPGAGGKMRYKLKENY